jgi:hypothetical protein
VEQVGVYIDEVEEEDAQLRLPLFASKNPSIASIDLRDG